VLRRFFCFAFCLAVLNASAWAQEKKDPPKKKDPPAKKEAAQPTDLYFPEGFKVELLATSDPATQGSWINLAVDGKGRLITGGQRGQSLLRMTVKDGAVTETQKLDLPITEVMGILWAFDSLYVNGSGPKGFGLYKCKEDATGKFTHTFLKEFKGAGEHGPHAVVLGPDQKIYVMNGNHTDVPEGMSAKSQYRNFKEDHLLPRQWDGNGHAAGKLAPGGYVVRTDAEGKEWELVLGGYRNAYDMAFNIDGELFTFDSDMEWDWGMPWYRPTRINHCTSGSDAGWRSGTGVWPSYYPDSIPSTVDIGVGSPTGVSNAIGAKFPAKYQRAIYICDWTYGRLIAVHLTPKGSSYTATYENIVAPLGLVKKDAPKKPLNLTDVVVGGDGAMYFTIGGRGTQAALYRLSYVGKEATDPIKPSEEGKKERDLRHSLEVFHGKEDPKAVEAAWPHLSSDDRFLRYAARVAIEFQPVASWKEKALKEKNANAAIQGLLALARYGDAKTQPEILAALANFPLSKLTPEQQLDKLRVIGVTFTRQGRPTVAEAKKIIAELDPLFPSQSTALDREISQVLIYLQAPGIANKCLKLMAESKVQEDIFHYMFYLRTLPFGQWTIEQRKEYLSYWTKDRKGWKHPPELIKWFEEAGRGYGDGASFANFLKNFLRDVIPNLSEAELKELTPTLAAINDKAVINYNTKPRQLVKEYKTADLLEKVGKADTGRNFERGRDAFIAGQCIKCHRMGDEGGAVGPDLTAINSRFARKDILESITEPSKVLSDQYQNETFTTLSGKTIVGRVVDETPKKITVQTDPLSANRVEIPMDDLDKRAPSKVSPMPANLIDVLTEDEILDLFAYMESGGNKNHRLFKK